MYSFTYLQDKPDQSEAEKAGQPSHTDSQESEQSSVPSQQAQQAQQEAVPAQYSQQAPELHGLAGELPQRPILGVSEDLSGGALVRKVCRIPVSCVNKAYMQFGFCKFCQICGLAGEPPQRPILGVSEDLSGGALVRTVRCILLSNLTRDYMRYHILFCANYIYAILSFVMGKY